MTVVARDFQPRLNAEHAEKSREFFSAGFAVSALIVIAYHFKSNPTRTMRPCSTTDGCRYVAALNCVLATAV
jgi:hypothetical protein